MASIIFQNVIDNINSTSNNINSYFEHNDYNNTNIYDIINKMPKYNFIIYILIIFLIFHFIHKLKIGLNEILAYLVCIVLIYLLIKKDYSQFIQFTEIKKNELDFLHKLMFNNKDVDLAKQTNLIIKPAGSSQKSYLYLNPLIVTFFYNIRQFSQINISSYVNSLIHCNNVIGIDYQCKIGLDRKYLNYEMAIEESKKALNELNSLIYNLPSTKLSYIKFDDMIKILHGLLNKHILDIGILFKNQNKLVDITIHQMPDNFYDSYFFISPDDTKKKGYMSVFDMY